MVSAMDLNDLRAWHTVVLLIAFVGIIIWAYSKRRKTSFDEAANLPFADEDQHKATIKKENLS
jgi:cytochrome c oxidase cbb3-type subunit 4